MDLRTASTDASSLPRPENLRGALKAVGDPRDTERRVETKYNQLPQLYYYCLLPGRQSATFQYGEFICI